MAAVMEQSRGKETPKFCWYCSKYLLHNIYQAKKYSVKL